ncbi:MAG: anhydro-N-acetylmuramic acid kinase [Candidatus Sumerlaeaceae bacterium]|nr:anhydro-N-acetylmuramic acid kinase [Candidatus Sumerlaeaceae bacterium]
MVKDDAALILSLMSGTSVDSVDAALCCVWERSGKISAQLIGFHEHPYPPDTRRRLLNLMRDTQGALQLTCSLNYELAHLFADSALSLLGALGYSSNQLSAVASHGQTVYHLPPPTNSNELFPSTLQIGEPAVIALRVGAPTIANFRSADMAAGGQGAPLVPFADYHLFSRRHETIVVQNIGGIANCTVLPEGASLDDVVAFDTGPGNVLIDLLVARFFGGSAYDNDGVIAASGQVLEPLLAEWMNHPFIHLPPPKSTGREVFGPEMIEDAIRRFPTASPADLVATATRFTARSIAWNLREFVCPRVPPIATVYLAGGGAYNTTLRRFLADELRDIFGQRPPRVATIDELGIPSKARECVAFAILGYARLHKIPANVPTVTGASRKVLLGVIYEAV